MIVIIYLLHSFDIMVIINPCLHHFFPYFSSYSLHNFLSPLLFIIAIVYFLFFLSSFLLLSSKLVCATSQPAPGSISLAYWFLVFNTNVFLSVFYAFLVRIFLPINKTLNPCLMIISFGSNLIPDQEIRKI